MSERKQLVSCYIIMIFLLFFIGALYDINFITSMLGIMSLFALFLLGMDKEVKE